MQQPLAPIFTSALNPLASAERTILYVARTPWITIVPSKILLRLETLAAFFFENATKESARQ